MRVVLWVKGTEYIWLGHLITHRDTCAHIFFRGLGTLTQGQYVPFIDYDTYVTRHNLCVTQQAPLVAHLNGHLTDTLKKGQNEF